MFSSFGKYEVKNIYENISDINNVFKHACKFHQSFINTPLTSSILKQKKQMK